LNTFEPGAFFTAEEMKILQNATKYNKTVPYIPNNTLPFGGFEITPQTIQQMGGISEEVINANPKKFRDVLRFLNNGQVDDAVSILRSIDGVKTNEIIEFRNKAKNLSNLVQEGKNVLQFDKAATQKGNGVFTALKAIASEIPAVAKVIQALEWGMSKGLPILGILAGAVEVIVYYNQLKSAPEEEKADIKMDIAQGVINIVGNACMLFPPAVPVGTAILGINFAADLVQGQSKNLIARDEGFENAEQMKKTKQIAEQDLSVQTTNPEVTKIMDYIIKKNWLYLSDPIGYKTEVSQLLTPNKILSEAGSLYGSDANANFWKWSKYTNSPEYLELIQAVTQLKQKLYKDARGNFYNFVRTKNPGFTPPRSAKVKVKLKYA
jgi:ribosomal protein L22